MYRKDVGTLHTGIDLKKVESSKLRFNTIQKCVLKPNANDALKAPTEQGSAPTLSHTKCF